MKSLFGAHELEFLAFRISSDDTKKKTSSPQMLVTDNYNISVGETFRQIISNQPILIGLFSQKLSQTQQRYFRFDLYVYINKWS